MGGGKLGWSFRLGQVVLVALAALGGLFLLAVALASTSLTAMTTLVAIEDGNAVYPLAVFLLMAWGVAGVILTGGHPWRGLPFHVTGVLAPLTLAMMLPPLRSIQLAGIAYIAALSWTMGAELVVRLILHRTR
ncbi:MAG: hypothetical protein HY685_03240 [Chloroflexi bacterium]|nr:hypothetical protein [Chloroflexota bacterium]